MDKINKNGENIIMEERFNKFVEWYGDMIDRGSKDCFDMGMFVKYFPFIKNRDMLERCIDEENEEGCSDNWDNIIFVEGV